MASMQILNPATNKLEQEFAMHSTQEAKAIVDSVHESWLEWRKTTYTERAGYMMQAAAILRENKQRYAETMTKEMGKPLADALGEIEKCAWVCEYYAEHAESILKPEMVETDASKSFITYNSIGVVLAVMPWNFPHWQAWRFIAPALMAGNVGVLKHASNVPGSAMAIEEVIVQAGFPKDVFRTLLVGSSDVAEIIEHPKVRAVTLTGSTPAGKAVAAKAGGELKKTVLELGGSDAYVVLSDADVQAAAKICATSRMINGGQSCIAAKRFIVETSVYDAFVAAFTEHMQQTVMGDPMDSATTLGPQARHDLRDELHEQVEQSIAAGAVLELGGVIPEGEGAFYPATVLSGVTPGMVAFDDELFGPVAAIVKADSDEHAVTLANTSIFGLGSAVFTSDVTKGEQIAAEQLEAGAAFVNSFVKSDPRLPFGGIKQSGYGRELSQYGIKEFVNIKSVYVA